LHDHLFDELEVSLDTKLDMNVKETLKRVISDFEHTTQNRMLEEKEQIINQLKQNLVELTEKRFRTSLSKESSPTSFNLNNSNIEFMLNEKDQRIKLLLDQVNDSQNEINKLKRIIKEQDDVILSHNNNLYVSKVSSCLFSIVSFTALWHINGLSKFALCP
jgi:hypothetical protein